MLYLVLSVIRWVRAEKGSLLVLRLEWITEAGVIKLSVFWWKDDWIPPSQKTAGPNSETVNSMKERPCSFMFASLHCCLINLLNGLEKEYRTPEHRVRKNVSWQSVEIFYWLLQFSKVSRWQSKDEDEEGGVRSSEVRKVVKCFLGEWEKEWTTLELYGMITEQC